MILKWNKVFHSKTSACHPGCLCLTIAVPLYGLASCDLAASVGRKSRPKNPVDLDDLWCVPADPSLCRLCTAFLSPDLSYFQAHSVEMLSPGKVYCSIGFCSVHKHSGNMPGDGLLLDRVEKLPANMTEKVLIKS